MIDYSGDYQFWSNTEAVTVTLSPNAVSPTSVSISKAMRNDLRRAGTVYNGIDLQGDEVLWSIPYALLNPAGNGREIDKLDRITDADAIVWTVISATEIRVGSSRSHFECVCNRAS